MEAPTSPRETLGRHHGMKRLMSLLTLLCCVKHYCMMSRSPPIAAVIFQKGVCYVYLARARLRRSALCSRPARLFSKRVGSHIVPSLQPPDTRKQEQNKKKKCGTLSLRRTGQCSAPSARRLSGPALLLQARVSCYYTAVCPSNPLMKKEPRIKLSLTVPAEISCRAVSPKLVWNTVFSQILESKM